MTRACGDDRPMGIARVRLDGTGLHGLGPEQAALPALLQPRYAPSGRRLAAFGDGLRLIDADGTVLRRIVGHVGSLDW